MLIRHSGMQSLRVATGLPLMFTQTSRLLLPMRKLRMPTRKRLLPVPKLLPLVRKLLLPVPKLLPPVLKLLIPVRVPLIPARSNVPFKPALNSSLGVLIA